MLKTCAIRLTVFVLMPLKPILFSQDFSDGTIRFIFRPDSNSTQFAVWMEETNGKYEGTVFLAHFIGRGGGGNRNGGTDIDAADGSDGKINPPDPTITTAANLLRDSGGCKFKVVYTPGRTGVEDGGSIALSDPVFSLGQNCPNPFSTRGGSPFGGNSGTEIRYFLPQNSHVNLTVYDILGRSVAVLIDRQETAGNKTIRWDGRDAQGRDVPNGSYIYKIQAGGKAHMKRMVFLE